MQCQGQESQALSPGLMRPPLLPAGWLAVESCPPGWQHAGCRMPTLGLPLLQIDACAAEAACSDWCSTRRNRVGQCPAPGKEGMPRPNSTLGYTAAGASHLYQFLHYEFWSSVNLVHVHLGWICLHEELALFTYTIPTLSCNSPCSVVYSDIKSSRFHTLVVWMCIYLHPFVF